MSLHPLAERLVAAIETRTPLDPATVAEGLTADLAYDVQDEVVAAMGGRVEAAKLGLTSRAKQEQMEVKEPSYGWLLTGSRITAENPLVVADQIQPRAEPEIAFLLAEELEGPEVSPESALAATAALMPAIDILDSRYAGYSFTSPLVIADNASAARFSLGPPVPANGIDLRTVGCVFSRNGELLATAAGAAVLDHPAHAVAWFVRKLWQRGRRLEAGTVVLTGALTAAFPVVAGDEFTVEIDRIGSLAVAAS